MPRFVGTEKASASNTTKAVKEGQPATGHHYYEMTTPSVHTTLMSFSASPLSVSKTSINVTIGG